MRGLEFINLVVSSLQHLREKGLKSIILKLADVTIKSHPRLRME